VRRRSPIKETASLLMEKGKSSEPLCGGGEGQHVGLGAGLRIDSAKHHSLRVNLEQDGLGLWRRKAMHKTVRKYRNPRKSGSAQEVESTSVSFPGSRTTKKRKSLKKSKGLSAVGKAWSQKKRAKTRGGPRPSSINAHEKASKRRNSLFPGSGWQRLGKRPSHHQQKT